MSFPTVLMRLHDLRASHEKTRSDIMLLLVGLHNKLEVLDQQVTALGLALGTSLPVAPASVAPELVAPEVLAEPTEPAGPAEAQEKVINVTTLKRSR